MKQSRTVKASWATGQFVGAVLNLHKPPRDQTAQPHDRPCDRATH
jgi:hypothetical protein